MTTLVACPPFGWPALPSAVSYFLRDFLGLGRRSRRRASRARFADIVDHRRTTLLALDCGANVGLVTEKLLDAGYVVHAFEPDPIALADFHSRLQARSNLTLHQTAVGIAKGTATLFRHKDIEDNTRRTKASSLIKQPLCDDRNTITVEVASLPDFIAAQHERIGILKLDIEGFEVDVLNTLLDHGMHHRIDYITAETHERFGLPLAWRTAKLRARVRHNGIKNVDLDYP